MFKKLIALLSVFVNVFYFGTLFIFAVLCVIQGLALLQWFGVL